ncbi:MAG TPA: RnfABCDGE type electron transport complex subunit G [Thermotogota bacterium]|nr:RnfABCDGE type electron transport complex subunit G [Thermotogota bacterium]
MGSYFKTGLVLMAFSIVVGLMLSVVYLVTSDPIASAELDAKLKAIKTVLTDPQSGKLLISEDKIPQDMEQLNQIAWKDSGEADLFHAQKTQSFVSSPAYRFTLEDGRTAYILSGGAPGYGGNVVIMASFVQSPSGYGLFQVETLDYSGETPGLGANISLEKSRERFAQIPYSGLQAGVRVDRDAGVNPTKDPATRADARKNGVVIISDIMTGATITPRAVANTIDTMFAYLQAQLEGE